MNPRSTHTLVLMTSLAVLAVACKPTTPASTEGVAADAATQSAVAGSSAPAAVNFDPAIPTELLSPAAESGGECGIEATATVPQGAPLTFVRGTPAQIEGWALVRESKSAPESVYLKLASNGDASYFVPASMVSRQGLGIRLGDVALDRAGFKVSAALDHVPAGEYSVQVAQRIDGRVLLCATGRTAVVSE